MHILTLKRFLGFCDLADVLGIVRVVASIIVRPHHGICVNEFGFKWAKVKARNADMQG